MIVYKKANGVASDLRFVPEDYKLAPGEIGLPGDTLPPLDSLSDPADPKQVHNDAIDAQIAALEAASGGYIRGVREFFLGAGAVFNAARAACAADTTGTLKPLGASFPNFLSTPGMVKIKALDDQIVALRAQRTP